MKHNRSETPPVKYFEIQKIDSIDKRRHSDSPTSSILKTPTPIFVTTRSSSTKRLKFANGPVDLQTLKNGSNKSESYSNESLDNLKNLRSSISNGEKISDDSIVEVALSPVKTMQVSPETWKAFLEYKKYNDYSNETEKTDYTYSRLSKFRHKEIIPGFLIMPNLCRTSISSKRSSSIFSPSIQSPTKELYSYDFKVHSESGTEDGFDFKTPSFGNKVFRSKYNLRSSGYDGGSVGEIEGKPLSYEQEYFNNSAPETFFKATHSTSLGSEGGSLFSTKVRPLDLDDTDMDEVDEKIVDYKKQWCSDEWARKKPETVSQYFSNFFSTIFLYVTSFVTLLSDQFSKHVLRKKNELGHSPYSASGKNINFPYSNSARAGSFMSWSNETPYYYSGDYYGSQRKWYEKIYYYFYDKFMGITNLFRGSSPRYASSRYYETSRRRKFWWLLIPLLLLAGSFLGYIDFYSNPKAILNVIYNCILFIPSFLYYTVMVFIPNLIFNLLPYFVLTVIPHFVTVSLPYFFLHAVPYYFWAAIQFFASVSIVGLWNGLSGAFLALYNFIINFFIGAGQATINLIMTGYLLTSKYLMLFFSHFSTYLFSLILHVFHYVSNSFEFIKNGIHYIW